MKKGILTVLSSIGGAALGTVVTGKIWKDKVTERSKMSEKHLTLYLMMNQWVRVKQENKSIAEYLEKQGYKEIAIYGMNYVGETLLNELKDSNIKVMYGIDKNAASIRSDIDIKIPDNDLPMVNAIIVTAITFFEEIEEMLYSKIDCPVLSMEDILYEI